MINEIFDKSTSDILEIILGQEAYNSFKNENKFDSELVVKKVVNFLKNTIIMNNIMYL